MSVNPVDQIKDEQIESPLNLELQEALRKLAVLEPSPEAPYLTVILDWVPQGENPNMRPGRRVFADQTKAMLDPLQAHTPEHDSLSADVERISDWLDNEVDPSAQSICVVACNAKGVFETFALGVPVPENLIVTGPVPHLSPLVRVAEDFEPYVVLLADQKDAVMVLISQRHAQATMTATGDDWPRHQMKGGWSQRRFQNGAQERIDNFAKEVSEELRSRMDEFGVQRLILAMDEVAGSAYNNALHQSVQERVVGTTQIDIRATMADIIRESSPIIDQAERDRERETVQAVEDSRGEGNLAVVGAEDVIVALQTGQVMTLVINDDFRGEGWGDFTFPVYGVGAPPKQHPAGGDTSNIVPLALEQEMIRLAIQIGAEIEIVDSTVPMTSAVEGESIRDASEPMPRSEAAQILDAAGGVAALLRYALSDEQSTATV